MSVIQLLAHAIRALFAPYISSIDVGSHPPIVCKHRGRLSASAALLKARERVKERRLSMVEARCTIATETRTNWLTHYRYYCCLRLCTLVQ